MNTLTHLLPAEFRACAGDRPRILVVDDDSDYLAIARRILESGMLQVETAENGPAGFRLLNEFPFDAAVIDLRMTGMSGLELMDLIHQVQPSLPVMLASGAIDEMTSIEALELGCREFLEKPHSASALMQKVRALLEMPKKSFRFRWFTGTAQ